MVAPMRERTRSLLLATAVLTVLALGLPGAASAQAPSTCPDTFEVLHDDTIGALYLPRGDYTITLLSPSALSCAEAADLFRQFLEDYDGRLPRPWVVDAQGAAFTRGANGSVGFLVASAGGGGGGGGGGHHPTGAACPGMPIAAKLRRSLSSSSSSVRPPTTPRAATGCSLIAISRRAPARPCLER
jgi:hypothetical protein